LKITWGAFPHQGRAIQRVSSKSDGIDFWICMGHHTILYGTPYKKKIPGPTIRKKILIGRHGIKKKKFSQPAAELREVPAFFFQKFLGSKNKLFPFRLKISGTRFRVRSVP
jgi:hypothetical protein